MSDDGKSMRLTRGAHKNKSGRTATVEQPQQKVPKAKNQFLLVKPVQNDSSNTGRKKPKKISKRKHDDGLTAIGPGHIGTDGRDEKVRHEFQGSKRCKTEKAEGQVKAERDTKKNGPNTKPAASAKASSCAKTSSGIAPPSKQSSSPGALSNQLSPFEMNVMAELTNVADINEFLKDQVTAHTSSQSASTGPAMISEGAGGKFQIINIYWLDMCEDPKNPGVLYIFGKVNSSPPGNGYSSCCVVVKNLERKIFLLPREKADKTRVSYMDVYNEFYSVISPKYKITSFTSKRITKKYCFGNEQVPSVAEYMEVRYSGSLPALPEDLSGETFSHAFGTNATLTETFLLEGKLKESCWLQISCCEQVQPIQQQSWCKFEFTCDVVSVEVHPDSSALRPPTLVVVALHVEEVYDVATKNSSIILVGVAVNRNVKLESPLRQNEILQDFFCLLNKPPGQSWPLDVNRVTNERVLKMDSERSLLECLLTQLHELDPDVFLGGINYFWHDLLKKPHWSGIGRLKRSAIITKDSSLREVRLASSGRLFCDAANLALELQQVQCFQMCHDVETPCHDFLSFEDNEVPSLLIGAKKTFLFRSSEGLRFLVNYAMQRCVREIRLMKKLKVMPSAVHIASITGTPLSQILSAYDYEQCENLLLHAFNVNGYIVPDKLVPDKLMWCEYDPDFVKYAVNANELTSKGGFYKNIVVKFFLHSISLFLCAIQDLTVLSSDQDQGDSDRAEEEPLRTIREEIWKLKKSLKESMSLMEGKDVTEDQMRNFEILEEALRWAISSMYESWQSPWRFDTEGLKECVTAKAHDVLLKIKESVERMGFELIYGTEDTLMIDTHSQDYSTALKIRKKVQDELDRTFPFLLVFDVFMYRYTLVLKNDYICLEYIPGTSLEHPVDVVQQLVHRYVAKSREARIASYTSDKCLREIVSGQPLCDKVYKVGKILWDVSAKLKNKAVPLIDLLISKKLTEDPENYKQVEGLDHVTVAMRMNKAAKRLEKFSKVRQVSGLYCTDGQLHHLSEIDDDDEKGLKVDINYYLERVLHPLVSEICQYIPELGFSSARVADALGLDSSQYERPCQDLTSPHIITQITFYSASPDLFYVMSVYRCNNVIHNEFIWQLIGIGISK